MALTIWHESGKEYQFYVDQVHGTVGSLERWELYVNEFTPLYSMRDEVPTLIAPHEREVARLTLYRGSALDGLRSAFVAGEIELYVFEACVAHVLDRIYGDSWAEL